MVQKDSQNIPWVIKTSGVREQFSVAKLRRSLERSGADEATVQQILDHILPEVTDGTRTSLIYKHAFALLKKNLYPAAVRYSLRKAVMELGPSGFPFEIYVSEVLRRKGYTAETGVVLPGFCVLHEVDIYLRKNDKHIFAECKFHNQQGIKVDIKVALYIHARFLDLKKGHESKEQSGTRDIHEGWLITNTKMSADAIQYANCVGLRLLAWDYPEKGNLQDLILETGVHPLTFLSSLSSRNKTDLLAKGIVMCRELKENEQALRDIGFSEGKIKGVLREADRVCQEF